MSMGFQVRRMSSCIFTMYIPKHCCSAGNNSKLINTHNMYFASIQVAFCSIIMNMFFCQIGKNIIKLAIRVDLGEKLYC